MNKAQTLIKLICEQKSQVFRKVINVEGTTISLVAEYYSDTGRLVSFYAIGRNEIRGQLAGVNPIEPRLVPKVLSELHKHLKTVTDKIDLDNLDEIIVEDDMPGASSRNKVFTDFINKLAKALYLKADPSRVKGGTYIYRISVL